MKLWAVFVVFLLGIALGALGVVYGPTLADPYLPEVIRVRIQPTGIEGTVKAKQKEPNRLLLRVETPQGAILAAFNEKVPEVDLLIGEEDQVTLGLRSYKPFVENPPIQRVKKHEPTKATPGSPPMAPAESKGQPKA